MIYIHPQVLSQEIVTKTAGHVLDDPNKDVAKWFYIWCGDVAGELGELLSCKNFSTNKAKTEIGDIVWGMTALCRLLDCDYPISFLTFETVTEREALLTALELIDYGKKVARDGIELRPITDFFVTDKLRRIAGFLYQAFGSAYIDEGVKLMIAKLEARYPNGYSPEASVNRTV